MSFEKTRDAKLEEFVKSQIFFLKLEEEAERKKLSFRHVVTAQAVDSHLDEDVGPLVSFDIVSAKAKLKKGERLAAMVGLKKSKRGTVFEVTNDGFSLSVKNTKFFPIDRQTDFCLVPCGNCELQQAVSDILSSSVVYKAGEPARRLRDVLMGLARARASTQLKPIEFFNPRLDKGQREAVSWCMKQKEVAVIHGPPGTGKSTTLVELVKQMNAKDQRVLVCAASNAAVDNMMDRVKNAGCKDLVRIGHPANMEKAHAKMTLESLARKKNKTEAAILNNAKVVFGTLTGCFREVCVGGPLLYV